MTPSYSLRSYRKWRLVCFVLNVNWRLGVKIGAERRPPPGIQAQHPAPAPHASHARHDRSMARNRLVASAKVGGLHFSPSASRKVVPSQWEYMDTVLLILASNKVCWEYMESTSLRHPIKTMVLWIFDHSEFQNVNNTNGNAIILACRIDVMESLCLRHLIKIRVWWIHDSFNISKCKNKQWNFDHFGVSDR